MKNGNGRQVLSQLRMRARYAVVTGHHESGNGRQAAATCAMFNFPFPLTSINVTPTVINK